MAVPVICCASDAPHIPHSCTTLQHMKQVNSCGRTDNPVLSDIQLPLEYSAVGGGGGGGGGGGDDRGDSGDSIKVLMVRTLGEQDVNAIRVRQASR